MNSKREASLLLPLAGIIIFLFSVHIYWGYLHIKGFSEWPAYIAEQSKYLLVFILPFLFLRPFYASIVNLVWVLLYPIEIASIYVLSDYINTGTLGAIIHTNKNEAFEFGELLKPLILISFFILAGYIYLIFRLKNFPKLNNTGRIIITIIVVCCVARWEFLYKNDRYRNKDYSFFSGTLQLFQDTPPLNVFHKFYQNRIVENQIKECVNHTKRFQYGAYRKLAPKEPETYILMIGESCRYSNWGINGYYRNTSPNLEKTINLLNFSNYYSSANTTRTSLPLMLTGMSPQYFLKSYSQTGLLSAFKEAGFRTYFISNQCAIQESYSFFFNEADSVFDISGCRFPLYDEKIFPYLDKILNNDSDKLIVINLMGNHGSYNERHPPTFDIYKPNLSSKPCRIDIKDKQYFINSYDNSILYQDFIIYNTIQKLKNSGSVSWLMFTSDHGESLFDDNKNIYAHTNDPPPIAEIHVPLFMWLSEEYSLKNVNRVSILKANQHKKLSSENIFPTLLELSGITIKNEETEKSFTNDRFKEPLIRKVLSPAAKILFFE